MVLAYDRIADRSRVPLQVHQRVAINFRFTRPRTRSALTARIQAAWLIPTARPVRRLHDPADRLEFAACLDHASAFAIARKSRSRLRSSPVRAAEVSRPTFSRLFAFDFCGPGLGRHPQLAAGESTIQSFVSDVVWVAGVRFLLFSFDQQSGIAKLGWSRL